jgi:2-polyprenyl-3-methyl-5-hydroxy-6-metoxy-1,4-benzoquinol methylase
VESHLANPVDSIPERFVPAEARGQLTEAEHFARYLSAARLARGRSVLDAGCGIGYGTNILAEHGATSVVGIDIAEAVIEAAKPNASAQVSFLPADICKLPFDDAAFELITCFEVIEHIEGRDEALGELARVLATNGVLAISSPNRDAYVPGNPHHLHEYVLEELEAALRAHFAHVSFLRQHDWIGSAILDDSTISDEPFAPLKGIEVARAVRAEPGSEPYIVALAGHMSPPHLGPTMVLTGLAEVRKWLELWDAQQQVLSGQHEYFQNLTSHWRELGLLREELRKTESELNRVPELEHRCDELTRELEATSQRANMLETTASRVYSSASWRLTKPLRTLKRIARGD